MRTSAYGSAFIFTDTFHGMMIQMIDVITITATIAINQRDEPRRPPQIKFQPHKNHRSRLPFFGEVGGSVAPAGSELV